MTLFDNDLDVDEELYKLIDGDAISYSSYIIMSKSTYIVFSEFSELLDKKNRIWTDFDGVDYRIAIDKGLKFGEVIIK